MRNGRNISGRIGGTLSRQADHVGLGSLPQGEQWVHLTLPFGDCIEPTLQVCDLSLERGDRFVAFLAPLFAQSDDYLDEDVALVLSKRPWLRLRRRLRPRQLRGLVHELPRRFLLFPLTLGAKGVVL